MEVIHLRCAGLDVHKDTVVACVRLAHEGATEHHVETFGTTTKGLLELADWLGHHGCTPVLPPRVHSRRAELLLLGGLPG